MNAETMMVDPNELVIDMPLDEANVNMKVESMRNNGMIQDVTVWLQDMRIIDGFHRTEAARRLGWKSMRCKVVDCSETAFWDARIQSARQHHKIEGERLQVWIRECWRNSDWPDVIAVMKDGQIKATNPNIIDAFVSERRERNIIEPKGKFERWLVEERGIKYWHDLSEVSDSEMRKVKGMGPARRAEYRKKQEQAEKYLSLDNTNPLSTLFGPGETWTEEDEALTVAIFIATSPKRDRGDLAQSLGAWFKDKAKQWGINVDWLVESIFSELVDQKEILSTARFLRDMGENPTIGDTTAVAKILPVNGYYRQSDDTEREAAGYLKNRREGETWDRYRARIRDEDYLSRKRQMEAEALRKQMWEESDAGKEAARKDNEKRATELYRLNLVNASNYIRSCGHYIQSVPAAPAMLAEFAQFVADFSAEHFPDMQVASPNPVALENSRLRAENARLKERISSLERALGSKQAAGEMLSSAIAWSSGDLER